MLKSTKNENVRVHMGLMQTLAVLGQFSSDRMLNVTRTASDWTKRIDVEKKFGFDTK